MPVYTISSPKAFGSGELKLCARKEMYFSSKCHISHINFDKLSFKNPSKR